jgi:pterin-4a-carbinolamine dehydratase
LTRVTDLADRQTVTQFINRVSDVAEGSDISHHPDILIKSNSVELRLHTHAAHGLTEYDFRLAEALAPVFVEYDLSSPLQDVLQIGEVYSSR